MSSTSFILLRRVTQKDLLLQCQGSFVVPILECVAEIFVSNHFHYYLPRNDIETKWIETLNNLQLTPILIAGGDMIYSKKSIIYEQKFKWF